MEDSDKKFVVPEINIVFANGFVSVTRNEGNGYEGHAHIPTWQFIFRIWLEIILQYFQLKNKKPFNI